MDLVGWSDASLYTYCNYRTQYDEIDMLSKDRHGGEEHIPRPRLRGMGIVLLALIYLKVAASLASNKRFVSFDRIARSVRGKRSTHSSRLGKENLTIQLKLLYARI